MTKTKTLFSTAITQLIILAESTYELVQKKTKGSGRAQTYPTPQHKSNNGTLAERNSSASSSQRAQKATAIIAGLLLAGSALAQSTDYSVYGATSLVDSNTTSTTTINNINSGTVTNVNNTSVTSTNTNTNVNTNTNTNVNTGDVTYRNINTGEMTNNNNNTTTSTNTNNNNNVNTGTMTYNNNNVNTGTATNNNNNVNTGDMTNRNFNESTMKVIQPPPTAIAPAMMSGGNADLCSTGTSGSVQTQIFGVSTGGTVRDLNCERLKLSKTLYDMGMKVAAVATMCQDKRVFDAMMAAGTPCPAEGKIGEAAKEYWAANPTKQPKEEPEVKDETYKKVGLGALLGWVAHRLFN